MEKSRAKIINCRRCLTYRQSSCISLISFIIGRCRRFLRAKIINCRKRSTYLSLDIIHSFSFSANFGASRNSTKNHVDTKAGFTGRPRTISVVSYFAFRTMHRAATAATTCVRVYTCTQHRARCSV